MLNNNYNATLQQKIDASLSFVKHTQVQIELLDLQERPIGRLEGEVISGGISVDGDSAIRRTLNMVFLTTDNNYKILETSNPLSLNKKIKVYIGIKDLQTKEDKPVVWFKCGTYIMSKCTSSASTAAQQISITAQDKMCLHNGEVAGALEYTTRLDSETISPSYARYIENLQTSCSKLQKDLIHKERYLEEIESNLTIIYKEVEGANSLLESSVVNMFGLVNKIKVLELGKELDTTVQELSESISYLYINSKMRKLTIKEIIRYAAISLAGELPGKVVINDVPDKIKTPIIVDDKGTIGFKMIDYIYPSELTLTTGQPVSTVYEQCKQALGGNYEYFYDIDGNFIFQEIKNYLNNNIPNINDLRAIDYRYSFDKVPVQFDFSQYNIETSYVNTPNWNNIKNDFYVWGYNDDQLIGYHLVIDDKPLVPDNVKDLTETSLSMDWREFIIHNYDVGINNNFVGKCYIEDIENMDSSKIGNVCCVVDKEISAPLYRVWNGNSWEEFSIKDVTHMSEYPDYYIELSSIWKTDRYKDNYEKKTDVNGYNYNFDIIEGDQELSKFSVKTIGRRKMPVEDDNVKQLYPTIIEDILVYYDEDDLQYTSNPDKAIKLSNIEDFKQYKAVGNIYKDAFSTVKELLFAHTVYNEQLQITCSPIYNLEVNWRCFAAFAKTNTNGYFLTKKINFNFDPTGLMTIVLIKAQTRERGIEDYLPDGTIVSEDERPLVLEDDKTYIVKEKYISSNSF